MIFSKIIDREELEDSEALLPFNNTDKYAEHVHHQKRNSIRLKYATLVLCSFTLGFFFHLSIIPRLSMPFKASLAGESLEPSTLTRRQQVVLFNGQGYHDEVFTAILETLSRSKYLNSTIYLHSKRWGIEDIFNSLEWQNNPSFPPFPDGGGDALLGMIEDHTDIFIDTTCGNDLDRHKRLYEHVLRNTSATFYCLVHHGDSFKLGSDHVKAIQPFVDAHRLRVLTLSEHVKKRIEFNWQGKINAPISVFVPVFDAWSKKCKPQRQVKPPYFAIQGDFGRRDHDKLLHTYENYAYNETSGKQPKAVLSLIGSTKHVTIPGSLKQKIMIQSDLPYPQFYEAIAKSTVLLPSLGGNYLREKATSSMPASLIAGVPVVVDEDILASYSYLRRSLVVMRRRGEDGFPAAVRYLQKSQSYHKKMRNKIQKYLSTLIEDNLLHLEEWIAHDRSLFIGEILY